MKAENEPSGRTKGISCRLSVNSLGCLALLDREAYRPGLPSVDQVRAHEARGGWWLAEMFEDWEPEDHMRWSRRPCSPDGTPLPWPETPGQ